MSDATIQARCPACGYVGRAPAKYAGMPGKCTKCQAVVTIPLLDSAFDAIVNEIEEDSDLDRNFKKAATRFAPHSDSKREPQPIRAGKPWAPRALEPWYVVALVGLGYLSAIGSVIGAVVALSTEKAPTFSLCIYAGTLASGCLMLGFVDVIRFARR